MSGAPGPGAAGYKAEDTQLGIRSEIYYTISYVEKMQTFLCLVYTVL